MYTVLNARWEARDIMRLVAPDRLVRLVLIDDARLFYMRIIISPPNDTLLRKIIRQAAESCQEDGINPGKIGLRVLIRMHKDFPFDKIYASKNSGKMAAWRFHELDPIYLQEIQEKSTHKEFKSRLVQFCKTPAEKYILFTGLGILLVSVREREIKMDYFLYRIQRHGPWAQAFIQIVILTFNWIMRARYLSKDIVIHAAGLSRKGKGYLFSGKSGSGKSTICRLSRGSLILHDDRIMLKSSETMQEFNISGLKKLQQGVRLKQMFFIRQSKVNRIEKMRTKDALKEGFGQMFDFNNPFGKPDLNKVDFVFRLFHSIPTYRLYFKKEPTFWNLIENL